MTSLKNTYTGQLKLVLVDSTITLQLTNVTSIVFKDFPTELEMQV